MGEHYEAESYVSYIGLIQFDLTIIYELYKSMVSRKSRIILELFFTILICSFFLLIYFKEYDKI